MNFLDALEETILTARSTNMLKCLGNQGDKGSLIWQFCMYNRGVASTFGLRMKGHQTRLRVYHENEKVSTSFLYNHMSIEWADFFVDASTYKNQHAVKTEMLQRLNAIRTGMSVAEYKTK